MKREISLGRQIYVVFPLIEESKKLDHKNLMDGYENLIREFPLPDFQKKSMMPFFVIIYLI